MSDDSLNSAQVAEQIARRLAEHGREYALGGAIALGYWSEPRGTVDVDVTLFLPPDDPHTCVACLRDIGCEVPEPESSQSLYEHGFCRVHWNGVRVDVFLPIVPFYETAKQRRVRVQLGDEIVSVWDAESICVFKMMFFRRKDIADVEQLLRVQPGLDRLWIREQLLQLYGKYDPRLSQWDELADEVR